MVNRGDPRVLIGAREPKKGIFALFVQSNINVERDGAVELIDERRQRAARQADVMYLHGIRLPDIPPPASAWPQCGCGCVFIRQRGAVTKVEGEKQVSATPTAQIETPKRLMGPSASYEIAWSTLHEHYRHSEVLHVTGTWQQ